MNCLTLRERIKFSLEECIISLHAVIMPRNKISSAEQEQRKAVALQNGRTLSTQQSVNSVMACFTSLTQEFNHVRPFKIESVMLDFAKHLTEALEMNDDSCKEYVRCALHELRREGESAFENQGPDFHWLDPFSGCFIISLSIGVVFSLPLFPISLPSCVPPFQAHRRFETKSVQECGYP